MSTKKIAINPEFFKLTSISSKKKSKKEKKEKPSSDLVKKDLKKQLISKVNEHRNKIQKDKLINESKVEIKEIPDNITILGLVIIVGAGILTYYRESYGT